MKPTRLGYIIIVVTAAFTALYYILDKTTFFGFSIITIGFIHVTALLVVVSYQVWKATSRRKVSESTTWLFIFIGSIACVLLSFSSIIRSDIFKATTAIINTLPQIFSVLAYICFVIGLFFSLRYFRGQRKTNPWIPFLVIAIIAAIGIYLMVRSSSLDTLPIVTFIIFILFDSIMLYLSWMNAATTWGGKFAWSYSAIAVGFLLLVSAHVQFIFIYINSGITGFSMMQSTPLFLIAVGILALGTDLRLSVEHELEG